MAERDTQSLFLEVDASIELLRRNLVQGEAAFAKFESRADKTAESVGRRIAAMGDKFGPFQQRAESAAQAMRRSFEQSLAGVGKIADTALANAAINGGKVDLGVGEMKAAAEAARLRALSLAAIEQAANRAALAEGNLTSGLGINLQAARSATIAAEEHARALLLEAGNLERLEIEMNQASAGALRLEAAQRRGTASAGQMRAGSQQLGFQISDVAAQFSAGTPPMMIFAQQGSQVVQAISLMKGEAGGLIGFLSGPWGAAIMGAVAILAALAMGHNKASDAKKKHKEAADLLGDAVKRLTDAAAKNNHATRQGIIDDINAAKAKRDLAKAALKVAEARLAEAEASRDLDEADFKLRASLGDNPGRMMAPRSSDGRLEALRGAIKLIAADIAKADGAVGTGTRLLIERDLDAAGSAAVRLEDRLDSLKRAFERGDFGNRESPAALAAYGVARSQAQAQGEAEQRLERQSRRSPRSSTRDERTSEQVWQDFKRELAARGIVQAEGRTGFRTAEDQHQIYMTGATPLDGYKRRSRHQTYQALDPTRASHDDQKALAAARAAGLTGFEIVTESGGRKHYEWTGAHKPGSGQIDESGVMTEAEARAADAKRLIEMNEQERQARRKLLDAQRRSADTETERDQLLREDIEAEFTAQKIKIEQQLKAQEIDQAQADRLNALNEQTREQRQLNVTTERLDKLMRQSADLRVELLDEEIAMAQLEGASATTAAERRAVELRILELQRQREEQILRAVLADPEASDADRARAQRGLERLPRETALRQREIEDRNRSPLDDFRARLAESTKDTNASLEAVAAGGLQNLEDGLVGVISGTVSVADAFKRMASSIIADLARIAIQKLIVSAIGGGFGFAEGGAVIKAATGGFIQGPGSATSDSIPAWLSNGEFVMRAEAVRRIGVANLEALNSGRLPGYARGGAVSLRAPRLPSSGRSRSELAGRAVQHFHINAQGAVLAEGLMQEMRAMGVRATLGGAQLAQQQLGERQFEAIP